MSESRYVVSPTQTLMYYINNRDTHGTEIDKIAFKYKRHNLTDKSLVIFNLSLNTSTSKVYSVL